MSTNDRHIPVRPALLAAILLLVAGAASALDVEGTIVTKDGDKRFTGVIRWKAVARVYVVSQKGTGGSDIDVEVNPDQVKERIIPEPAGFRDALKSIQDGKPQQAIPVLERIAQDYVMLQWDDPAGRALADAYLKSGDPAGAVRACEKVIAVNPEAAYRGEMAPLYWQALLKKGGSSVKLDDLLDQAVKTGSQESSAFALIIRGDLLVAKGDNRAALKDGYLRVVTLFRAVRAAQPEALFKAAKAFEQLNQGARAEDLRKRLLTDYGSSPWAAQVKGG